MYFDARAAKLLLPGAHLVISGCPGLRLVATASTRTWVYRYRDTAGLMKQTRLGHWPAVPAASAAAKWQALREARASGEDVQALTRPKPTLKSYAVTDLVNDYITGHVRERRGKASSLASERALLRFLFEAPAFAGKDAASVSRADCFDALDVRKSTPTAAAKLRSLMGAAWDYALDSGRLSEVPNWWRLVMRGRLKSKGKIVGGLHVGQTKRVLTRAEVAELLAWLPNMHSLGRDVTVMYLWTCCRGGEIVSMRPEHVKREGDQWWWTIPTALTKNAGNPRAVDHRVPLLGRALEVVQRRIAAVGASGYLFEDMRGGQYSQNDFSTYLYSLHPASAKSRSRQGEGLVMPVLGWTAHDLRRTGRTLLAEMGCPQEVAEATLGHLPSAIVGAYNRHSYDVQRLEWLGRLSSSFAPAPEPAADRGCEG